MKRLTFFLFFFAKAKKKKKMLTVFQQDILQECLEKKSGGLSLPMGSGKTLIALKLSQELSPQEPVLVIASKTLLCTWENEIKKFFGDSLPYEILHKDYLKKNMGRWTRQQETRLVLTTTEVLTKAYREHQVQEHFILRVDNEYVGYTNVYHAPDHPVLSPRTVKEGVGTAYTLRWGCVVVDEAHGYCNIQVDKCRCIASICAHHRWLLSGTLFSEPNPSNLLGYYTLIKHPDSPGDLVSMASMMRRPGFCGVQGTIVHRSTSGLLEAEKPTYKVRHELVQVPMTENEVVVYERIKKVLKRINASLRTAYHPDTRRRFASYLLAMITYLRQIMVAPIIVLASVAVDVCRMREKSELSEILMSELRDANLGPYLESPDSLYSSRVQAVLEKLEECWDRGTPRILVFSAFRTSLRLLQALVEERFPQQWSGYTLEGGQSMTKKSQVLEGFEKCSRGILYLTYKTGSEGLNLQHTDTVFLLDTMWNASTGEQAVARVARQGQKSSTVNIYTFMSNTGIEKAILEKHVNKMDIAKELMQGPVTKHYHHMRVQDVVKMVLSEDNASLYRELRDKLNQSCE